MTLEYRSRDSAPAYQWVRVRNALGAIHEIIDGVLEDNLPRFE